MASGEKQHDDADEQNRWQARPVLALLLKLVVLAIPILCSLAVAWVVSSLLPPSTGGTRWVYRAVVVVCALASAMLAERGARRLLPMTTLLQLSLLFPDQAPSRFKIARKSTSKDELAQLADKRDQSVSGVAADIVSLLARLASHDKRTRGHAERVRVYTDLLAQQMRLSRDDTDRLRWGALLHDIGKLSVDPAILNKAGKPSEEEWEILKGHPTRGAEAAATLLAWLGEWGSAIAEHHERFDGSGYPAGLAGQEISRAGRMIAVVDAYEVMTAARSYKRPMPTQKAREELTRCAGTHFDPAIVRAFLGISLPRLLWATGPLSLLAQLPFLGALRDVVTTVASAGAPAVAAAASAVVVAAAGPAAAPVTHATLSATPPKPIPSAAAPTPSASITIGTTPVPKRIPAAPSASASAAAVATPAPSSPTAAPPSPLLTPTPTPTSTPSPTPSSTPSPSPSPSPTPTPTVPPPAAPAVTMTGGPAATTTATDALVSFNISDPAATVTCALDGAASAPCTSPWSAIGLALGHHSLVVAAGNAGGSSTATYTWDVVTPAPIVTITAGPPSTTTSTSASVTFGVSDPFSSVTCSLDGAPATPCTSPWTASGLSTGVHEVTVTASNAQGTNSASYNWTVLPPAPVVTVTGGPASSTTATFASVSFTVSDPTASVTCSLDGGAAAPCSSPWTASALSVSAHSLVISASNAGGSGSANDDWTVVSPPPGAPTVTITGAPPASSSSTSASVTFSVTPSDATLTCSLDGAPASACASPWSTTGLSPGAHSLVVFGTKGGQTGSDSTNWTVLNNSPVVSITSAPPNPGYATSATVGFNVSDSSATVTCSLDGGAAASCTSPWSGSGLAVGSHTLSIIATHGGKTGSASASWTILPPPNATITSGPANGSSNFGPTVTFAFISDTPGATFQCSLDGGAWNACTSPQSYSGLLSTHTFSVRATISGVAGPAQSRTFFLLT